MRAAEIPPDAVELRTARQAALVVGVTVTAFERWAEEHSVRPRAMASGPPGPSALYLLRDLEAGRSRHRNVIEVRTVRQAAAMLEISRPNMDKWLRYRSVLPWAFAPKPVGRLYRLDELEKARVAWLADRNRIGDERRREAALANQDDGP